MDFVFGGMDAARFWGSRLCQGVVAARAETFLKWGGGKTNGQIFRLQPERAVA